jgi:hypothetical protein
MLDDTDKESVIVDLSCIRIEASEAEVEAYYRGDKEAVTLIKRLVKESLEERMRDGFLGEDLIEHLEIE